MGKGADFFPCPAMHKFQTFNITILLINSPNMEKIFFKSIIP